LFASPALAAAEAPRDDAGVMALCAAGVILLALWIARRAVHPRPLLLARTPGRPNTVEPLHLIFLLLVWSASMACMLSLLPWIAQHTGLSDASDAETVDIRVSLLATLTGQICLLTACLFAARMTFRLGLSRGLGLSMRHWFYDSLRAIIATLAFYPVCRGLTALSIWRLPKDWVNLHPLLQTAGELGPLWSVPIALSAIVMAPLVEEIFFRGMIQSMLRRYTGSPWAAVVITSVAFAAVHAATPQNLLALFALSLVLGYNYERTGRLTPVIGIHFLFNAINLVQFWAGT